MKKNNKKKFRRFFIFLIFFVFAFSAFCAFAEFVGFQKEEKAVKIVIPKGAAALDVAEILVNNDLIDSKYLYYLYAKIAKPDYRYGTHEFSAKGYSSVTKQLCTDDNLTEITFTFPEGQEMKEIAKMLSNCGLTTIDDFYKAANPKDYDYWFLENLPEREEVLEGYLFPDTYTFNGFESAHEIINVMLKNFDRHISDEMRSRVAETGLSFDEIITLASVVEREAAARDEFKKVAGVFYNRINKVGESNGYLESCATVQYILKDRKAVLSVEDTKIDSPYNTYKYPGLPLGPIACPGLLAINAALYPESTDYLYFVANGNGRHYFAKDYQTHLENTRKAGL